MQYLQHTLLGPNLRKMTIHKQSHHGPAIRKWHGSETMRGSVCSPTCAPRASTCCNICVCFLDGCMDHGCKQVEFLQVAAVSGPSIMASVANMGKWAPSGTTACHHVCANFLRACKTVLRHDSIFHRCFSSHCRSSARSFFSGGPSDEPRSCIRFKIAPS